VDHCDHLGPTGPLQRFESARATRGQDATAQHGEEERGEEEDREEVAEVDGREDTAG
jgi:hypothetical protein